jgi:WD40 repeat protein
VSSLSGNVLVFRNDCSLPARELSGHTRALYFIDRNTLAIGYGTHIYVHNLQTGQVLYSLVGDRSLAQLSGNKDKIFGAALNTLTAWDLHTKKKLWTNYRLVYSQVIKAVFKQQIVAIEELQGTFANTSVIRLLDASNGNTLYQVHCEKMYHVIASTNDFIITGGAGANVIIWNNHLEQVRQLSCGLQLDVIDGNRLAISMSDYTIAVYDISTGANLMTHQLPSDLSVQKLVYTGTPGEMVLGCSKGIVVTYNVDSGTEILRRRAAGQQIAALQVA